MSEGDRSSVELRFAAHASGSRVSLGDMPTAGHPRVDRVYLSVANLRFRPADGCEEPGRATVVSGPIVAELVGGDTSGLAQPVALARARYCRLDLALRRAGEGTGVASLADHAVLVRGRRDDGVEFLIRSSRRDIVPMVARDPKGFAVDTRRLLLFVAVDLDRWFEGIDLSALVPGRGRNGIIRIDERSNREILRRFESNLRAGIALCRDLDDDSTLSARECSADRRLAAGR